MAVADENARLVAFYNAARAEIVQRLTLRETVVLAYLTTSGLIGGIAYKADINVLGPILQVIPLMSIGFTLEFLRHEWVIANIGSYLFNELGGSLDVLGTGGRPIRDWDRSQSLRNGLWFHLILEKGLSFMLIVGPAAAAIWLSDQHPTAAYPVLYRNARRALHLSESCMVIEALRVLLGGRLLKIYNWTRSCKSEEIKRSGPIGTAAARTAANRDAFPPTDDPSL